MVDAYRTDVGHIEWLSLDPQRGREQPGRRPFLILSRRAYNEKTSLAVGVPITSHVKGYPFEVTIKAGGAITGVALADQIKSLDRRARFADFAGSASPSTLRAVRRLVAALLEF